MIDIFINYDTVSSLEVKIIFWCTKKNFENASKHIFQITEKNGFESYYLLFKSFLNEILKARNTFFYKMTHFLIYFGSTTKNTNFW